MSFICIEYLSSGSGNTPIVEMMVSTVKDAFITGCVLDNSNSVIAWRIKDLQGGLKFNYGWAPEEEWNKYKQVFYPESRNPLVDFKPSKFIVETKTSHDPHVR